jgi:hypothetical protein
MTDLELELDLGPVHLSCKRSEVGAVFAGLLREVRAAAERLDETDRHALRFIMGHPNRTLSVSDVFPAFERNSAEHAALRRLRTAQFVLPVGPDKWDHNTVIETKPFARFLWERFGEPLIFDETAFQLPLAAADAETPAPGDDDPFATLDEADALNDVIEAIATEHRAKRPAE